MKKVVACVGALCAIAGAAQADVLMIPLAGWQADGGYNNAGNTNATFNLPIGTTIDAAEYVDLEYTAQGASWRSDLVISLNDSIGFISYWDTRIVGAPDSSGPYGPVSAAFDNPGLGGSGPFTLTTGELYVEVYDVFNDSGVDEVITGGMLVITYTVPAPGAFALLGGAGLLAARRRRS